MNAYTIKPVYRQFIENIKHIVNPKRIYTDQLRRLAWGTDAGFYRLIPQLVIRVENEEEVKEVLKQASKLSLPVTFRAAGTSLSGQAISDSILMVAGKAWENYRLLDAHAHRIALQPGIIGQRVSEILQPYGRVFSPDPASKKSAMVGGIVANNASGMKCGTHANSDRVLESMRIILADGTLLDTGDENSCAEFRKSHPDFVAAIESIRDEIMADTELKELIEYKYSIKNVTGLNLRPFITFDNPFDIIAHSIVGSEGTLAFMAEVTMETEAQKPFSASAMVYFKEMSDACRAVVDMRKAALVQACELLDKKSLASVHDTTGEGLTALLIQIEALSEEELNSAISETEKLISNYNPYGDVRFSRDPAVVEKWWLIRSGVFPAVGGTRPLGTTSLIEDIAFHIEDLPKATVRLASLLEECGYDDACIYGHALEGNYHFVIAQKFDTPADVEKYKTLMKKIEELVVDTYHGSLKAEHGTGRNMAPFVEKEWGAKAFGFMKRIKATFDPQNILNPGVIFNDDPDCYVRSMKPLPVCDPHVDKCIECGFCEVNCVSCGLTLSARQRIVTQREISRLKASGEDNELLAALEKQFRYYGNETCAGDGLCSTSCPMKINTGELIHDIREKEHGAFAWKVGRWTAKNLATVSSGLRLALGTANMAHKVLGDKGVTAMGNTLHKVGFPVWTPSLPKAFYPGHMLNEHQVPAERKLVYFPSCINRTMGAAENAPHNEEPLPEVFVRLCRKAGWEVIFPKNISGLCCGLTWESKGMPEIADAKLADLEAALAVASEGGKYPVVCDQSPCLHRMRTHIKAMKLHEPAEFILDYLISDLKITPLETSVAVHITCSSRLMGISSKIVQLAAMCARNVTVPAEVGCCGFAGDKGFTHPELNRWGLRKLKPAIKEAGCVEGFSNSRTCEIGLTTNSGIPYKSIVYLVDRCSEAK